jgi:hypothetical protein
VLVAGCQPQGPKTVDVSGKITYGGGPWPKAGKLTFPCIDAAEGYPNRPGSAAFDVDGNFIASSYGVGDGLNPGRYKVHVECWETPPSMDETTAGQSYVPDDLQLEFEVHPTDNALRFEWDVPKRVP